MSDVYGGSKPARPRRPRSPSVPPPPPSLTPGMFYRNEQIGLIDVKNGQFSFEGHTDCIFVSRYLRTESTFCIVTYKKLSSLYSRIELSYACVRGVHYLGIDKTWYRESKIREIVEAGSNTLKKPEERALLEKLQVIFRTHSKGFCKSPLISGCINGDYCFTQWTVPALQCTIKLN
jgi:hypothetical protein